MESLDKIEKILSEHVSVVQKSMKLSAQLAKIVSIIFSSMKNGGTVFWYGNGGSAADAQHMAAELVSRFKKERSALRSIALTTDTSILTAIGNDYSFDNIFERQIEALARKGDICVGLSTSGNSKNVYKAHIQAKSMGAIPLSLLGSDGGIIKDVSDLALIVPSSDTPRIQEVHTLFSHIICELIESMAVKELSEKLVL